MARKEAPVADPEADSELDPGEDATAEALARLESLSKDTEATNGDAWVDPVDPEIAASPIVNAPAKSRARSRRKPPANIGEPSITIPVVLKLVSFGRGVSNVTATLGFEVEGEHADLHDFMGAMAWSATFRGDYLGEGLTVRDFASKVDGENIVKDGFKALVPRWDQGVDQLERYIQPLLPDDVDITGLFALSTGWRLNVTVEVHGALTLHEMQQSFDLTAKATTESDSATYDAIP